MIYRTLYQGLAILIAFFMATTVSIVSVSSDDKVKPSNNPVSGWTELIGDAGLTAWTRAPLHAKREFQDKWAHVGTAGVTDQQAKMIISEPGTGIIVNGSGGRSWNIISKQPHADVEAHIEFMVPRGLEFWRVLHGPLEIQALDDWGRKLNDLKHGDCGGIYQRWDSKRGKGKERFEDMPKDLYGRKKTSVS